MKANQALTFFIFVLFLIVATLALAKTRDVVRNVRCDVEKSTDKPCVSIPKFDGFDETVPLDSKQLQNLIDVAKLIGRVS